MLCGGDAPRHGSQSRSRHQAFFSMYTFSRAVPPPPPPPSGCVDDDAEIMAAQGDPAAKTCAEIARLHACSAVAPLAQYNISCGCSCAPRVPFYPWERMRSPLNRPNAIFLGGPSWEHHGALTDGRGGPDDRSGFIGNLADLALFSAPLSDRSIRCLYRQSKKTLGSCQHPKSMWGIVNYLRFRSGASQRPSQWERAGVGAGIVADESDPNADALVGDTESLRAGPAGMGFCATQGCATGAAAATAPRYLRVAAPNNFAADASFSLNLWFTKGYCNHTAGADSSTLFHWPGGRDAPAAIDIQLVCLGARARSSLPGHVIRVAMVDDAGSLFAADTAISTELENGELWDTWAELTVVSSQSSVGIAVDGAMVSFARRGGEPSGAMGWPEATQRDNIAYPNPDELTSPLTSFTLGPALYLGGGPQVATDIYIGTISSLITFDRPLDDSDRRCLFRAESAKQALP